MTGDDQIALGHGRSVMQADFTGAVHGAVDDPVRPRSGVEGGDGFVGFGDEDRRSPGGEVLSPCAIGGVDHGFLFAADDAVVACEGVDRLGTAVAELEGGGLLPLVGEAVDVE